MFNNFVMPKITQKYTKLMTKYKLPKLKELEAEFNFVLEEDDKIIEKIFEKVLEKVEEYSRILECSIFSSHDPSKLYEIKMAKEKREELFEIYKKMMSFYWEGKKLLVVNDEKKSADYIKKIHEDLTKNTKEDMINLFELFENEWKKVEITKNNDDAIYYG